MDPNGKREVDIATNQPKLYNTYESDYYKKVVSQSLKGKLWIEKNTELYQ